MTLFQLRATRRMLLGCAFGALFVLASSAQPTPPAGSTSRTFGFGLRAIGTKGFPQQFGVQRRAATDEGYTDIMSNGNIEGIYTGFSRPEAL